MAKLPHWLKLKMDKGEIEVTPRGFVEKSTGELLSSRKMTDEQIAEITGSKDVKSEKVEETPVSEQNEKSESSVKDEEKSSKKKTNKKPKKVEETPVSEDTTEVNEETSN